MKDKLKKIMARLGEIRKAEEMTDELREERDRLLVEADVLTKDIEAEERALELEEKLAKPAEPEIRTQIDEPKEEKRGVVAYGDKEKEPPFKNLGQQLRAIYVCSMPTLPEDQKTEYRNRLNAVQKRATGLSAKVDTDVGFAIQTDFVGPMLDSAVKSSAFLSLCDTYTLSEDADRVRIVDVDETSIATTVYGGVIAYWAAEAATVTASKPQLREVNLELYKMMGLAYASGESMKHTNFINDLYTRSFTAAMQRLLEGAVISGNGVGKPQGITNAPALISRAIETGQTLAVAPILYKNITGMWHRLLPEYRANSVWLCHPDMEEYLEYVDFPVGTGGVPVFQTAGAGMNTTGVSSLKGRPVIPTDHCSTLGSVGDIILAHMPGYLLLNKGGIEAAQSMHVQFIYDEMCFRFIMYSSGRVRKPSALTIKNSSTTRGEFITLAART